MTTINLEYIRHRVATELPSHVRWLIHGTPLDFDFTRAQHPFQLLSESDIQGTIEKEWTTLYLFGDRNYAEGGGAWSFIGVDGISGVVRGLDVESNSGCLFLLNSDIEAFINTFMLFDNALRHGITTIDAVLSAATQIDPAAFEQSEWAILLDYILNG